ncbi:unnamed protein product [Bursaphelenchus okinawaensis]|uniref:Uncharacterized protein n=1 Tax=Bursaphelenchus okinawaensis TaxID=465554 RepID=A0A811JST3_9BILA|nr:unnamed protein product [Bursaphelenchus okinawaensis]CAG9081392.1 unnamed protein product [Bursaphelenchus okinawaensis]
MSHNTSFKNSTHKALDKKLNDLVVDFYNVSLAYSDHSMNAASSLEEYFRVRNSDCRDDLQVRAVQDLNDIQATLRKTVSKMTKAIDNLKAMKTLGECDNSDSKLNNKIAKANVVCNLLFKQMTEDFKVKCELLEKAPLAFDAEGLMFVAYWRESFRTIQSFVDDIYALTF